MKLTTRRHALALLGATTVMSFCAPAYVVDPGTDPFEGGIGGTGIVGVLNGFGSLLINGVRIELAGSTRYRTAFGKTTSDALSAGLGLTVFARRRSDRFVAEDVSVDYLLIGTMAGEGMGLSVNRVPVVIEKGAHLGASVGTRVAVSGLWNRTGVVASRVDLAPSAEDLVAGTVVRTKAGGFGICPALIKTNGAQLSAGQYGVAMGRMRDGVFDATDFSSGRFGTGVDMRQLSVEGYLEQINTKPGFRIVGLGHSFARNVQLAEIGTRRAVYFGRYYGLFGATSGYVVPEDVKARRAILKDGIEAGFDGTVIRT